jgi:hypothetical protein
MESMTPLATPQQSGEWVELMDPAGYANLETRGGSNDQSPQSLEESAKKVLANEVPRRRNEPSSGESTKIPWIVRAFMSIQDYMLSSPREVIVAMLGVALVFSFILSAVRRR